MIMQSNKTCLDFTKTTVWIIIDTLIVNVWFGWSHPSDACRTFPGCNVYTSTAVCKLTKPFVFLTKIVVSLVNGRPGAMNFSYSPVLRDFTKATNIRLRFLRTNTLLGHLMGKALRDPTVTRRVRRWHEETGQKISLVRLSVQAKYVLWL